MALLMLSLIMSMLVVKLLHHGEKEVRQMSVSACLLDRYGSGSHDLAESVMTSIKTLDLVNGSDGELLVSHRSSLMLQLRVWFLAGCFSSFEYSKL